MKNMEDESLVLVPKPHHRCGCISVLSLKIKESPENAEEAICKLGTQHVAHAALQACVSAIFIEYQSEVVTQQIWNIIDSLSTVMRRT